MNMLFLVLLATLSWSPITNAQNCVTLFNNAMRIYKEEPEHAVALLQGVIQQEPESLEAHYNTAYILKQTGNFAQALPYYEHVLTKQPGYVHAHIGAAQAHLAVGNYLQGWQDLEWHLGEPPAYTQEALTYLHSHYSLDNKIILLNAEWGIGDAIMMARYAQQLKSRGATVIIHLIHQALVPLFKQQPYFDKVIAPQEPSALFHFQIPIMSLPMVFETTVKTIPAQGPYITIDQALIDTWREPLSHDTNFKIGICWHGSTIHGEEKFMPLSYFAQLANIPGVSMYSLQRQHGMDQLNNLQDPTIIKQFDDTFDSIPFLDTAAVMKNLDLVITVDTSIAHLAGALGVPVWVVVPHPADWRWMIERNDSPWYPSMKLFRKAKDGNWDMVLNEIQQALSKIMQ
ncbi:MAG: hypothetical protein NTX86_03120 [Candidatus Dependentiae bacterium]|nr:hypothetical protein [Candidatus Dependentiae bacterium]